MADKTNTTGTDAAVDEYLTKNHADAERAIIDQYGLSVKSEQGQFIVVDPVYRKANRGKGGKYGPGGNLELLLQSAVKNRITAAAAMPPKIESSPATAKNGKTGSPKPSSTKARKPNAYQRAYALIIKQPDVTAEKIAHHADMSVSMAGYCLTAWSAAMDVLTEHGMIKKVVGKSGQLS